MNWHNLLQSVQWTSDTLMGGDGLVFVLALSAGLVVIGVVVGLGQVCRFGLRTWRTWRVRRYLRAERRKLALAGLARDRRTS